MSLLRVQQTGKQYIYILEQFPKSNYIIVCCTIESLVKEEYRIITNISSQFMLRCLPFTCYRAGLSVRILYVNAIVGKHDPSTLFVVAHIQYVLNV